MPLFPMFVDLKDKPVLIIGTGKHVAEKAEKLAPFGCSLIFSSTEAFAASDLEGVALVVLADRHHSRNAAIANVCRRKHIPVNAVDDPPLCDFQFPSLVQRQELVIGISTAGTAPALGKMLREEIQAQLPSRTEEILLWSARLTQGLRQTEPDFHRRGQLLNRILRRAFALNRPLTEAELAEFD